MAKLIVISWRDVPSQVVVRQGRDTVRVQLSARFQEAVDRAAMRAGKGKSDAYIADWKRGEPRDCGTGGLLDAVLREEKVERIPGAHCYEFFAGAVDFEAMGDDEPGTFYVTDFMLRHFDRLVIRGLGLDRHPELLAQYFGNYRRLVYLAQIDASERIADARAAAERLGLAFAHRVTGYGGLERTLRIHADRVPAWQS